MMDIRIEPMKLCHVEQIAALEKICFSDPWPVAAISPELDNPLSLWLCALLGDTVVGYVGSQTVLDETDMMNVAVAPEFRRRGIAGRLIENLERRLVETGSRFLTLEVRASNEAAISLYRSMGFEQIGLRRNYYHNPKEDALILRKELL